MNWARDTATASGCISLGLLCHKKNTPALALYHKLGYRIAYEHDDGQLVLCLGINHQPQ